MNKVRVIVPASTANLGPGFDTLGMAFQLYTTIELRYAEKTEIRMNGPELDKLPTDKSNLLYQIAAQLFAEAGRPAPELLFEVESTVPLTRGLGSSAAAIVGALVSANALLDEPFTREQLFAMACRLEGHPDNVGASLFGGFVVATMPDTEQAAVPYVRFTAPEQLHALAVIPDFWLSTEKARTVLPDLYRKEDMIYNVGHSSLLVAALAQGRLDLLASAMQDRLHQPYRAQLVPGLSEILASAAEHGAWGAALSGAGPTIICFYTGETNRQQLLSFVDRIMVKHQVGYQTLTLLPDNDGVQVSKI
ncbi:homoserine kinase [Brevibacillus fulvus]|uniref:Homoserine kinase n=1 Tax=Brevibacillus fulvus TaxID=1125967 RepID=A0A938XTU9_9BACL|nr:homoserine kinase [Brevibacillus fulvus]MBM7590002.1 homoserine kinase [Brevibacillus fulvus]